MKSLTSLSNEVLLQNTQALVAEERKITASVLWHLHEIQRRRLYSQKGYASLFEYAVQALGYSEAAAGRRISAMRLLVDVPEIEPALQSGAISLSTLCTVQSFLQRKEENVSKQEKQNLVFALQGKSRRECEKELSALDPNAVTPKERERVISPTQTEIRFVADDALLEKLKQIRELSGHAQTDASYLELFHKMADIALKKLDPLKSKKPQTVSSISTTTPPAELSKMPHQNPRFIPAALRRAVWIRDRYRCCFVSPDGRRCDSKFALEMDHKIPIALGGLSTLSNLQLLCRNHNRHKAVVQLGEQKMRSYFR